MVSFVKPEERLGWLTTQRSLRFPNHGAKICSVLQRGGNSRLKARIQDPTHRVISKPSDVSFIACIEEDGANIALPMLLCYEVPLLECAIFGKAKVINL